MNASLLLSDDLQVLGGLTDLGTRTAQCSLRHRHHSPGNQHFLLSLKLG